VLIAIKANNQSKIAFHGVFLGSTFPLARIIILTSMLPDPGSGLEGVNLTPIEHPKRKAIVHQVKYDLSEAQTSLEYILEQVIYGTVVVIVRNGIEIARVTAVEGLSDRATRLMVSPYEL
jgi:hypothetical protein